MKKKHFKKQIRELKGRIALLNKKCTLLGLILKWQSDRLDTQRELRIKKEGLKGLK